jgi:hypothetical protein
MTTASVRTILAKLVRTPITRLAALVLLAGGTAWIAHAHGVPAATLPWRDGGSGSEVAVAAPLDPVILVPETSQGRIEVAFVLDTTGSMGGLIDGAKRKIFAIANQMASARGNPQIRMALIGYRDRGDSYVTQVHDLSDDIDALYTKLQGFEASGGGDGPESVNQALNEAVTRLDWSSAQDAYRVIFLVGDAPPHMDYSNDLPYTRSVELARARGIVVNTIQCGEDRDTTRVWQEIARMNQGQFAAIAQDGGMLAMVTPQDAELSLLNQQLADTALAFGAPEERALFATKMEAARAAAPEAAADRLSFLSKKGGALNSGRADLVDAVATESVSLDAVPSASLPEPMQSMSEDERRSYVEQRIEKRKELKARIGALSRERDAHIAAENARHSADGKNDSFDAQVFGAIREQAAKKGIAY